MTATTGFDNPGADQKILPEIAIIAHPVFVSGKTSAWARIDDFLNRHLCPSG
jgi:hypothetical protein